MKGLWIKMGMLNKCIVVKWIFWIEIKLMNLIGFVVNGEIVFF